MRQTQLILLCVLVGLGMTTLALGQNNIALGKDVSASGPIWSGQVPGNMTDGSYGNQTHPLASSGTLGFTYEVDLGKEYNFERIELVNRSGCCPERLSNYRVSLFADAAGAPGSKNWTADIRTDGSHSASGGRDVLTANLDPGKPFGGRYIHIINLSNEAYNPQIAELEVFEAPLPLIRFFKTDSGNITATGNPSLPTNATLSWNVTGAFSVTLTSHDTVANTGTQVVSPAATTTYTLTATNASGSSFANVTVGVDEAVLQPVLNEFMADNADTLEDFEEESPDWAEIYNRNSFDLNLDGYYLTDDPDMLPLWRFPVGTAVPANGYLVVFLSGKDLRDPKEPLHTDFQLRKKGEYLALVAPDGTTVLGQFPSDYPATATYPPQKEDRSYGLGANQRAGFFDPPTPGAPNGMSFTDFVADTEFDNNRGFYTAPITVAITSETPGAIIRYTTDGSTPTSTHGTIYRHPVPISATTTLRARASKFGLAPTNVDTHTYIFVDDVIRSPVLNQAPNSTLRNALQAIPSMSIVTPNTVQGTSEVETSFELIFPDGTEGFQIDCGVKQFGGAFTNFAKKNFRMYFRSEYGKAKLKYPIFEGFERGIAPPTQFDQINLRSGSHDMNQRGFYMSNRFTDDTMLDMGNINPHGRFVHLYLNGTYWGQYHLRERWSASTISEYLGGPKSGYEAINGNWNVGGWAHSVIDAYDGDGSAWERIKSLADDYEALRPYNDMEHYIDYMLMFMFGNSEAEYRCVGPADVGSGFKWFLNDADGYLRNAGNRTGFANQTVGLPGGFGRSSGDGPGSIFSLLFKEGHPDFRMLLADRIHKHFFNDGAMTPNRNRDRLDERVAEVDSSFRAEAIRWGYRSYSNWRSQVDNYRSNILPGRTRSVVDQFRSAGFYPDLDAPLFSQRGGAVVRGFPLSFSSSGTTYYTTDGSDPRLPGGAVNPTAKLSTGSQLDEVIIAKGDTWKFLDDGQAPPADWDSSTFDDGVWSSGAAELGYGEDDEETKISYGPDDRQKYITTYFRKSFDLADPEALIAASLELKRDDGAIVYLNGTEVDRHNLTGEVDYLTLASTARDDGNSFHSKSVPVQHFQEGTNVIAVEIHQHSRSSSDVSFDFELTVSRATNPGGGLTLDRNTVVKARTLSGTSWSALEEAYFLVGGAPPVAPGDLALSEIHYNPAGQENNEFLELTNVSDCALNLRGVTFTDGVTFGFPDNRDVFLAPGEIIILVDSQFAIDQTYGIGLPIAGVLKDNLANNGERITLETADGTVLIDVTFDDGSPWPTAPDNGGYSLTMRTPGSDPSDPANWRASTSVGGTPGAPDGTSFVGDPTADLDQDGFTAFAEHALGTNDNVHGDAHGALELAIDADGHLRFSFPRSATANDAIVTVEISQDLRTWESGPFAAELFEVDGNKLTYRSAAANPDARDLFARLRFEQR